MNVHISVIFARRLFLFCACAGLAVAAARAQAAGAAVFQQIDAAVQSRVHHVAGFTDVETYDVYHGHDETHPAAELTVKMTYERGVGRSFEILSQKGSDLIRRFGLIPLLNHEVNLSAPGNIEHAWFTTENYEMKLKSEKIESVNGHRCYEIAITPRHRAPSAIDGTLWVNATDFSVVKVEGVASRRPSILAGTTRMMREYKKVHGYAMASRARAVANGMLIGHTVVTVKYTNYHLMFYSTSASIAGNSIAAAGSE